MNEVSTVSNLILKLIGIAICLGCAGTLYDSLISKERDLKTAIVNQQMSYVRWNNALQRNHK